MKENPFPPPTCCINSISSFSISACVGKEFLKAASKEVFLTGSCWNDAVAMAAAHKSLQISQRDQVAQSVLKKGDYFCSGLVACAQDLDLPFTMTGPSSMPYPWFEGDYNLFLQQFRYWAEMSPSW